MDDPLLDNARHLRYWQRCLRTLLPHQYTSNDSIRMTLGSFIVAAIDLLSPSPLDTTSISPPSPKPPAKPPLVTGQDRQKLRDWVLACQHPHGGFTGGPTHVLPRGPADSDSFHFAAQRPVVGSRSAANLAATLFALQLLALLGENTGDRPTSAAYAGIDRVATLHWLRRLQRPDGSFGEVLGEVPTSLADDVSDMDGLDGIGLRIAGGADMRYCYMAAMIRWMLRGDDDQVEDIDVEALVQYIRQAQTYDGGFSESCTHESHAGYAFCAIACLALLDRPLDADITTPSATANSALVRGIPDVPALVHWLVSRAQEGACDDEEEEYEDDEDDQVEDESQEQSQSQNQEQQTFENGPLPVNEIGFNGRCNKPSDTCYTWWVLGTLTILQQAGLASASLPVVESRRFLMQETQHVIGGFAKAPGGPPDLYHSYLGLAALAVLGEPSLKPFDPTLCISIDAVRSMKAARDGLIQEATSASIRRQEALLTLGKACWAKPKEARDAIASTA